MRGGDKSRWTGYISSNTQVAAPIGSREGSSPEGLGTRGQLETGTNLHSEWQGGPHPEPSPKGTTTIVYYVAQLKHHFTVLTT